MKFNQEKLTTVIDNAKAVYWSYLALDIANSDFEVIADDNSVNITIGETVYNLPLIEDGERVRIDTSDLVGEMPTRIKNLTSYTNDEKLAILLQKDLYLNLKKDDTYAVSTTVNDTYEIGGADKIELYPVHISNLGKMIGNLESGNDKTILVAMATGSGKSFTQALWMLVLHLSEVSGIFCAPKKLVNQLHRDMLRLLPEEIVNSILKLGEGDDVTERLAEFTANSEAGAPLMIASYEEMLDREGFAMLEEREAGDFFISFDEQHLVTNREDHSLKLKYVSQKFGSMFLTATPNELSYKLCGNKVLISMSKKDKQEQGYAQAAHNIHATTKGFDEVGEETYKADDLSFAKIIDNPSEGLKNLLSFIKKYFLSKKIIPILRFADQIVDEITSPAYEFTQQTRYNFITKSPDSEYYYRAPEGVTEVERVRNTLRWNVTIPAAEKMLIFTHDHDTLVNVSRALDNKDVISQVYHNGNVRNRGNIYSLFQIPDVERDLIYDNVVLQEERMRVELQSYLAETIGINNDISTNAIANIIDNNSNYDDCARNNIFCGLVNASLQMITGYDYITLDKMRYNDIQKLRGDVVKALEANPQFLELEYIQDYLTKKGIDAETAEEASELMHSIINTFDRYKIEGAEVTLIRLIDNWFYEANDNRMTCAISDNEIMNFVNRQKLYFVGNDLRNNENGAIENNVVYRGFEENSMPLYKDGGFNPDAKKRERDTIEVLDDTVQEYTYTPIRADITIDQLDAAYKLGFIPYLAGNTKIEGFNDANLQVTVDMLGSTADDNPSNRVQGVGRLRGLNPTKQPIYIQIDNRDINNMFDIESLEKNDYIPDYLSSTVLYNKSVLRFKGREIAQEVRIWLDNNLAINNTVDNVALENEVYRLVLEAVRDININNNHDISKTSKEFKLVLAEAKKELNKITKVIENTYGLNFFSNTLGLLLAGFSTIHDYFRIAIPTDHYNAIQAAKYQAAIDTLPEGAFFELLATIYSHMSSYLFYRDGKEKLSELINTVAMTDQQREQANLYNKVINMDYYAFRTDLISIKSFKSVVADAQNLFTQEAEEINVENIKEYISDEAKDRMGDSFINIMNELLAMKEGLLSKNLLLKESIETLFGYIWHVKEQSIADRINEENQNILQNILQANLTAAYSDAIREQREGIPQESNTWFGSIRNFFTPKTTVDIDEETEALLGAVSGELLEKLISDQEFLVGAQKQDFAAMIQALKTDSSRNLLERVPGIGGAISKTFQMYLLNMLKSSVQIEIDAAHANIAQALNEREDWGDLMIELQARAQAEGIRDKREVFTLLGEILSEGDAELGESFKNYIGFIVCASTITGEELPLNEDALKDILIKAEKDLDQIKFQSYTNLQEAIHNDLMWGKIANIFNSFSDRELYLLMQNNDENVLPDSSETSSAEEDETPDPIQEDITKIRDILSDLDNMSVIEFDRKYINKETSDLFDKMKDIIEVIQELHQYYNQITDKGRVSQNIAPRFIADLPEPILENKKNHDYRFLNTLSNKSFFLNDVRKAMPDLNKVNEMKQKRQAQILRNVADHILDPMHSMIGTSKTAEHFVRAADAVGTAVSDTEAVNALDRQTQRSWHNKAMDFASDINNTNPLTFEDAKTKQDCIVFLQNKYLNLADPYVPVQHKYNAPYLLTSIAHPILVGGALFGLYYVYEVYLAESISLLWWQSMLIVGGVTAVGGLLLQLQRERKVLPLLITPVLSFGVGCGAYYGVNWLFERYKISELLKLSPLHVMIVSASAIAIVSAVFFHLSPVSDHWRDNTVAGTYTWFGIINFVAVVGGIGVITYFMQIGEISLLEGILITSAITAASGLLMQIARRRDPGHIIGNTILAGAIGAAAFYAMDRFLASGVVVLDDLENLVLLTVAPAILSLLMMYFGPFAEIWKEIDDNPQHTVVHTANWVLLGGGIFGINYLQELGYDLLLENDTLIGILCGLSTFGIHKYSDKSTPISAIAGTAIAILSGVGTYYMNYGLELLSEVYTLPLNDMEINIISSLVIASVVVITNQILLGDQQHKAQ